MSPERDRYILPIIAACATDVFPGISRRIYRPGPSSRLETRGLICHSLCWLGLRWSFSPDLSRIRLLAVAASYPMIQVR